MNLLAPGLPGLAILVPVLAAVATSSARSTRAAEWLAIGGAAAAVALVAAIGWAPASGAGLLADPLAIHMALLSAFVALTGALTARPFWRLELSAGRADARAVVRGHALHSALLAGLLLALLADDLPLAWAGAAATVLSLVVSLRLGDAVARAAAWRLFLIGGAGLALALVGVSLLALAAQPVLDPGANALRWSVLAEVGPQGHGAVLSIAFAFLLLGYGTLAGLVPLHAGIVAAQAEGPAPLTGVLGGLLPGVALVTLLRARSLLATNPDAIPPGPPLLALGLLSLLLAALALRRSIAPRRALAVAGAGQLGVVAFAFGLGGGTATFAGLLHLTMLTLVRAALVQCVARAEQLKGGSTLGGLLPGHRGLGLTLAAGLVALGCVPPFGLFTSAFLVVMEAVRRVPVPAIALGLGLVGCAFALAARAVALGRLPPTPDLGPVPPPAALLPAWLHLAIVLSLGLAMPGAVVEWLAHIAELAR